MENELIFTNKLLCFSVKNALDEQFKYLKNNFCGLVFDKNIDTCDDVVFVCGDINEYNKNHNKYFIIKELSYNYEDTHIVSLGMVPINMHNVGVYFRELFDTNKNYFNLINIEHAFNNLTESNKPNFAFRKGLYISKVESINDELHYQLLRCSSNLDGPTDNLRNTDEEIFNKVNECGTMMFRDKVEFNHALVQVYHNHKVIKGDKVFERKGAIKQHSDKTKDMDKNALIAFCTFYDCDMKRSKNDYFDRCYKNTSVLTRLRFKLKVSDGVLIESFDVVLYPNSVFMISLKTNRLYTHEIVPSNLPIDKIPTRIGYVIRCSNTKVKHKDDKTFIGDIELQPINEEEARRVKDLYFEENTTTNFVNYENTLFSFNSGDYMKPII